ncbi:MAG: PilN domain-containing protein [Candidatus Omnitrophica bacterium]|nr:PilN domain-containing protein [Candidatus Omnitrophota bacterium]
MKRLKAKKNVFSSVELNHDSIKIAQAESILGKPKFTHLFYSRVGDLSKKETQGKIRSLLSKEQIEITNCLLCLPRHNVTTRYLKLPSLEEQEIEKMLMLQIPKLLPYAPGEILSSYKKITSDSEGYTYCIVILAQENLVRRYLSFLKAIGIEASSVILSSEVCAHWLRFINKVNIKNETIVLIDVDTSSVDIMIINGGELIFTRSFSRELQDTQGLSWQNKLQDEIRRTLETAEKEIGKQNITRLILSGSRLATKDTDKALSENFSRPVEIISRLEEECIKSQASIAKTLRESDTSFTSVMGAAVSRQNFSINLLPADIKARLNWQRLKKERVKCISLVLLIIAFSFGLFVKHIYDKQRLLKTLEQKIATLLPEATMREKISSRLEIIREQLKSKVFTAQLIKEIYTIIPDKIYLNSLSIQKDEILIIKGQADKLSNVFTLVGALEKSTYFQDVRVRYATKRKVKTVEITDFQIDCPLKDSE